MPTFKLGKNYRLKVSDMAATPVLSVVGGEGQLSFKGSSDKIDISSKDDGYVKSMAMGQASFDISLSGVCNTPDTGLTNLDTAFKAGTPVNINITNTLGTPTVVFAGSVYVGNKSVDLTNNQALKYSFDLALNGVPTIDTLFS